MDIILKTKVVTISRIKRSRTIGILLSKRKFRNYWYTPKTQLCKRRLFDQMLYWKMYDWHTRTKTLKTPEKQIVAKNMQMTQY